MPLKNRFFPGNGALFTHKNIKKSLRGFSIFLSGLLIVMLFYALYIFQEIKNVKERSANISALNSAAKQLRQSVSVTILGQNWGMHEERPQTRTDTHIQLETDIPVAFEVTWVLAAFTQPNHIVPLCSGASLACRLHASSRVLGIFAIFVLFY